MCHTYTFITDGLSYLTLRIFIRMQMSFLHDMFSFSLFLHFSVTQTFLKQIFVMMRVCTTTCVTDDACVHNDMSD